MTNSNNSLILVFLTLILLSCSRDSFEPQTFDCDEMFTYDNQIKGIVDNSCAYAGCHDGAGIGPGDYSTYQGLLSDLQSGSFRSRVILEKDDPIRGMPPNVEIYSQSLKSDLTEEELNMVSCWIEAGFPEN